MRLSDASGLIGAVIGEFAFEESNLLQRIFFHSIFNEWFQRIAPGLRSK